MPSRSSNSPPAVGQDQPERGEERLARAHRRLEAVERPDRLPRVAVALEQVELEAGGDRHQAQDVAPVRLQAAHGVELDDACALLERQRHEVLVGGAGAVHAVARGRVAGPPARADPHRPRQLDAGAREHAGGLVAVGRAHAHGQLVAVGRPDGLEALALPVERRDQRVHLGELLLGQRYAGAGRREPRPVGLVGGARVVGAGREAAVRPLRAPGRARVGPALGDGAHPELEVGSAVHALPGPAVPALRERARARRARAHAALAVPVARAADGDVGAGPPLPLPDRPVRPDLPRHGRGARADPRRDPARAEPVPQPLLD